VHEAILFNKPRYLKLLLLSGANSGLEVQLPKKDFNGFDAFEFFEFLKPKQNMREIETILEDSRPVHSAG